MPPKFYGRKRGPVDEYEADGGFVEDAPKSKKSKAGNQTKAANDDGSGSQYWEVGGLYSRCSTAMV